MIGDFEVGGLLTLDQFKHLKGTLIIEEVAKKSSSIASLLAIHNFSNYLVQTNNKFPEIKDLYT